MLHGPFGHRMVLKNNMIVYKYRSINKNSILDMLSRSFYTPLPSELNDPFDCFTHLYDSDGVYGTLVDDYYVVAFSVDKGSILLWSHYGDSHKGICLGFLLDGEDFIIENRELENNIYRYENNVYKIPITKVEYQIGNIIPYPDPENSDPSEEYSFLYNKSNQWAYEKEYRLIIKKSNITNKHIYYPAERLVSISFGVNICHSYRDQIVDLINNIYGKSIRIYQMERATDRYELVSKRI